MLWNIETRVLNGLWKAQARLAVVQFETEGVRRWWERKREVVGEGAEGGVAQAVSRLTCDRLLLVIPSIPFASEI